MHNKFYIKYIAIIYDISYFLSFRSEVQLKFTFIDIYELKKNLFNIYIYFY